MKRNFGVWILILCFGLSSVDAARANQIVQVQPIVVQPDDLHEINDQMTEQDRVNRDQESAIKGLIDNNQKLTNTVLARQQDASLDEINRTMGKYRDYLMSRERARVVTQSQKLSKYHDLIILTEDMDDIKGEGQTLQLENDVIEEKYRALGELKDEMLALNDKLSRQAVHENDERTSQAQEEKIQALTQRLGEMDQRIAHYDEILTQKDQQIAQLKNHMVSVPIQGNQTAVVQETSKEPSSVSVENMSQTKQLDEMGQRIAHYDEILAQKDQQIAQLKNRMVSVPTPGNQTAVVQETSKEPSMTSPNSMSLPPIVVNPSGEDMGQRTAHYDEMLAQKDQQIAQLKNYIATVPTQRNQTAVVQEAAKGPSSVSPANMSLPPIVVSSSSEDKVLKNRLFGLARDLNIKNEKIRWLNKVLAVTKYKTEYYKLTARQDRLYLRHVQGEVQAIKDDFARRFKDYNALQSQIGLLKPELESKAAAAAQVDDLLKLAKELIGLQQQEAALLNEKSGLQGVFGTTFEQHTLDLENKIKAVIVKYHLQNGVFQNRVQELQNELNQKRQQADLLKSELENKITSERDQNVLTGQIQDLKAQLQEKEDRITAMKARIKEDQQANVDTDSLKQQLASEKDKSDLLKQQLDGKVAESNKLTTMVEDYQKKLESKDNAFNEQLGQRLSSRKYQAQMELQIADLNSRLQEKEAQIVKIEKDLYDLKESAGAKDRDVQAKDLKDLNLSMIQQKTNDKQASEITDLKTKLDLARQELGGMPSSDEVEFLRTGLKRANVQLKQKDDMLLRAQASADEYAREFKAQTMDFQSVKQQLQSAYDEIHQDNEALKNKDLEITRLKEHATVSAGDWQSQVKVLTQKLEIDEKKLMGNAQENKNEELLRQIKANAGEYAKEFKEQSLQFESLKKQLKNAYDEIGRKNEDLRYKNMEITRLKERSHVTSEDVAGEKLKQALDKIDEQGRLINILAKKLQDAGQTVDLSQQ